MQKSTFSDRNFDSQDYSEPQLTMDEVKNFVDSIHRLGDSDEAQLRVAQFSDRYLGYYPNDLSDLAVTDKLDLLASSRKAQTLAKLSHELVGDMANQLGFADAQLGHDGVFDVIATKIKDADPKDAAVYMKLCGDIMDECAAIAPGMGETCATGLRLVADDVLENPESSAFVSIMAESMKKWVQETRFNPQRSFVTTTNNPNNAKISFSSVDDMKQESRVLLSKISAPADNHRTFVSRLSTDMIGIVDHTGMPISVAYLSREQEDVLSLRDIPSNSLNSIIEATHRELQDIDVRSLLLLVDTLQVKTSDDSFSIDPETDAAIRKFAESETLIRNLETKSNIDMENAAAGLFNDVSQSLLETAGMKQYLTTHYPNQWRSYAELSEDSGVDAESVDESLYAVFAAAASASRLRRDTSDQLGSLIAEKMSLLQQEQNAIYNDRSKLIGAIQQVMDAPDVAAAIALIENRLGTWDEFRVQIEQTALNYDKAHAQPEPSFLPVDVAVEDASEVFQSIHELDVRQAVTELIGVDVRELSLDTQTHVIDFMINTSSADAKRLRVVADRLAPTERVRFIEAFMAIEFGDDFGGILLELAESEDAAEFGDMADYLSRIRGSAKKIGNSFESDDPDFKDLPKMITTAFTKRTTELLALARRDGIAAISESMSAVDTLTHNVADGLSNGEFDVIDVTKEYGTLRRSDATDNALTLTVRPHGKNARIGMTTKIGKQRVNVRLDYEDGQLSLDIGSTAQQGVNASDLARKVGMDLAKGELAIAGLRANAAIQDGILEQNIELHGNHVREAFKELSQLEPEEFAGIVNRFLYAIDVVDATEQKTAV